MSNYYDNMELKIERAILAEEIILPKVTKERYITHDWLKYNTYISPFTEYEDTIGKFFIPILTPMVSQGEVWTKTKSSPSTKGHKGDGLQTRSYNTSNYISLYIPKYILLNFVDKIPKGTEFILSSINNSIDIDDMRIIGIYSLPTEN